MSAFTHFDFILINLSLIFLIFVFVFVIRMKGKGQIHYAFLVLMVTTFIWGSGTVILYYGYLTGMPIYFPAVCTAYIGLILTPIPALYIGLIFAKTKIRIKWTHGALLIIPIMSIVMLLTNNYHHLFYKVLSYETLTQSDSLGSYFIIHTLYSYGCILVGCVYLFYFSVKNAGFFSRQSVFILLGVICSFGYNALLTFQIIRGQFHMNVIMFFFTFLFFFLAIIKFDLLNVVPIALQNIVDHISDCFLVVDKKESIIDYNKTFQDTFSPIMRISRKETLDQIIIRASDFQDFHGLLVSLKDAVERGEAYRFERKFLIGADIKSFAIEIHRLRTRAFI
jgi:two-component system, NtrC family, sensor histidine kinase HupT/HoxJ